MAKIEERWKSGQINFGEFRRLAARAQYDYFMSIATAPEENNSEVSSSATKTEWTAENEPTEKISKDLLEIGRKRLGKDIEPDVKKCGNCRSWEPCGSPGDNNGRCTNVRNPDRHIYLYHRDGWHIHHHAWIGAACPWHQFRRTK